MYTSPSPTNQPYRALLQNLGLTSLPSHTPPSSIPSYASSLLIFNLIFAYALTASRIPKRYYGFDHNACPRQDIERYGELMVKEGKISRGRWKG